MFNNILLTNSYFGRYNTSCTTTMDLSQDEFRDKIGQGTIKTTLTDRTRMQYAAALNRFKRWLGHKHPDLLNEGNDVLLPIPSSVMTTLMYHAMLNVDENGQYLDPPELYSLNHVNAYRNAIPVRRRKRHNECL